MDENNEEVDKDSEDNFDDHSNDDTNHELVNDDTSNDHVNDDTNNEHAEPDSGTEENQDFNFDESFEIESDYDEEEGEGESINKEQSEAVETLENGHDDSLVSDGEDVVKDNNNELSAAATADPMPRLSITIKKKSLTIVNKSPSDDIEH